jgi:hypothetical protein
LDKPEVAGGRESTIFAVKQAFLRRIPSRDPDCWIIAEFEQGHSRKCDSTSRFWWEKSRLQSFGVIKKQVSFQVVP